MVSDLFKASSYFRYYGILHPQQSAAFYAHVAEASNSRNFRNLAREVLPG